MATLDSAPSHSEPSYSNNEKIYVDAMAQQKAPANFMLDRKPVVVPILGSKSQGLANTAKILRLSTFQEHDQLFGGPGYTTVQLWSTTWEIHAAGRVTKIAPQIFTGYIGIQGPDSLRLGKIANSAPSDSIDLGGAVLECNGKFSMSGEPEYVGGVATNIEWWLDREVAAALLEDMRAFASKLLTVS